MTDAGDARPISQRRGALHLQQIRRLSGASEPPTWTPDGTGWRIVGSHDSRDPFADEGEAAAPLHLLHLMEGVGGE